MSRWTDGGTVSFSFDDLIVVARVEVYGEHPNATYDVTFRQLSELAEYEALRDLAVSAFRCFRGTPQSAQPSAEALCADAWEDYINERWPGGSSIAQRGGSRQPFRDGFAAGFAAQKGEPE